MPSNPAARAAQRIVLPYVAVAAAWLVFSDRAVASLAGDAASGRWLQTIKGLAFVLVTAGILYCLLRRRFGRMARVERELRVSEQRFTSLVADLPGMAYQCLLDGAWTLTFVSRGAGALTGYRPEQLLHSGEVRFADLVDPDDLESLREAVEGAARRRRPFSLEYRLRTAAGDTRWVWEAGAPVFGPDGEAVALEGFVMDVTDRKAVEEIERERARLGESARAVEEAIGAVGHELRTPLASQRLLVESLLEDDLPREERERRLRAVLEQTDRLADMATNMLEAARLRSGDAAFNWGRVELGPVLESAAEVMRPIADRARVTIATSVEPDGLSVGGDADCIRRLVLNLLSNACRHARGGVVSLAALGTPDETRALIEVRDRGEGMAPEVLARLGQAFALNRGAAADDPIAGVGLGLAICRRIVAAHGGAIRVASAPGKGTTFTVEFPTGLAGPLRADPEPIALSAA